MNLIYDYFKQYLKQTENFLNILLSEQNDEKLLANVFMDQEFAQNLINDINNFRSKTLKFNDFKAKYVAIIAKYKKNNNLINFNLSIKNSIFYIRENQTATPQPDNQPNRDIEAAQEKIEDNQNPSLLKPQLPKPQSQQNFEGDESPILEKNESLHHSQNKEKENPFMHEEEEENINIIGKQSGFKEIEKQSGIIDKHSGYLPQKETYDKQLSEKSSRIPEENSFKQNKIRPSSRRSSQVSNHNKSERNLSYQDPYNNEMHQQKQSHISSHDKPLTQSKGHNYHSEYQDEDKPEPNIYSHSDLREDKSKGLNYQSEIIENQKDSHSYSTKGLNYQSEFIKNKADSNPYNFRSVIARKDPSPNKASFQKLFKIEENHKIDPKKPSLNQIIPRNEEKISQIMNAKDIDRFSETSEKQQRSEIFDYNDVKNENQGLKEENHELKNKLSNIMNSYQETEKILAKLKMENEILQERRSSDYKEEYNSRKEEEIAEGNIDRLQQNNEALRIENQALNDYINRQQFENEQLKKNLDKHSFGNPTTEDFETIEILKKENQALRNYLMEYKLKVEENKSDLRDFEALNNLKKENEELKTHLNEIKQSKLLDTKLDNQLRNSVISHENFEFEDPKIQENLAGTSSFQTKFMFHNNPITNKTTIPKPFTISNNNKTTTIAQNSNNKKNSHWVKASNEFPDEEEEKENYNVPGSNSHIKNSKDISHYSISPHKKIFDKAPPLDTEDLRKSIEASSEKKKKSHEGSHNQSMEDYQNQRLSNYLKKSGKFSKNESQKSANTEQNRSFEENNNEKIMLNQSQKKGPVIVKSSMPYDGPRNFEENFDTNSILSNLLKIMLIFSNKNCILIFNLDSSLISITQANLRFEDSPYQTDLIYPFQKPSDYYQGKKANKSFKGFLIQLEKGSVFEEIEKNLRENSFRFKLSCLRNKSMFFDNNTLQLGLISGIYPHDQKSLLKMTVYFGNLTKFEINDFKIMYTGSSGINLRGLIFIGFFGG